MSCTCEKEMTGKIDAIIKKHKGQPGEVLSILEDAQDANKHKYLPRETLEYISQKINTPLSHLYSVVTFYSFFNLKPQGDHCVTVCRGTACHSKGSKTILESLRNMLGMQDQALSEEDKVFLTTKDNSFTLKTAACFGQCALAPAVETDQKIYSHMTVEKMKKIIEDARKMAGDRVQRTEDGRGRK